MILVSTTAYSFIKDHRKELLWLENVKVSCLQKLPYQVLLIWALVIYRVNILKMWPINFSKIQIFAWVFSQGKVSAKSLVNLENRKSKFLPTTKYFWENNFMPSSSKMITESDCVPLNWDLKLRWTSIESTLKLL